MATMQLKNKTAIVGIGCTSFSKNSERVAIDLAADASLSAISDAGLTPRDIDGVSTYGWATEWEHEASPADVGRATWVHLASID